MLKKGSKFVVSNGELHKEKIKLDFDSSLEEDNGNIDLAIIDLSISDEIIDLSISDENVMQNEQCTFFSDKSETHNAKLYFLLLLRS